MKMKTMTMIAALSLAVFAVGAEKAPAEIEENDDDGMLASVGRYFDFHSELTVYSAYIWRGQILYDTPVWQPAQNICLKFGENAEYGWIKTRLWSNWAINAYKKPHRFGNMSIVDETVSYNKTFFDSLDAEAGVIMYQFPNRHGSGMRDTDEFLAGLLWRNAYLTPRAYVYWDFDTNGHNPENMLYFDFDFTHAFKLTDALSLVLGSGFGVANGPYMDHYTKGRMNGEAFNNFHTDASLYYQVTKWLKAGCSLSYYYSLSRQVRHSNYDMHDAYNAGILRGGVHLVADF